MTMACEFSNELARAADDLKMHKLAEAKQILQTLSPHDEVSSEVQNLTGIFYELKGDKASALRHYRAAYALDPTNRCANDNIERLTSGPVIGHVKPIGYL